MGGIVSTIKCFSEKQHSTLNTQETLEWWEKQGRENTIICISPTDSGT